MIWYNNYHTNGPHKDREFARWLENPSKVHICIRLNSSVHTCYFKNHITDFEMSLLHCTLLSFGDFFQILPP